MNVRRSASDIVQRLESCKGFNDFFGVQQTDMLAFLPFEFAKPYLDEGVTEELFVNSVKSIVDAGPLAELKDYLPFAWEKANDCRGLSAGRSLDHIKTWLWLAGFESDKYFEKYSHYGKQQLVFASILVDFDWKDHDNRRWVNSESDDGLSSIAVAACAEVALVWVKEMVMTRKQ
jgi:hypothetical protein